jgi:hypothetical protein
MSNKKHPLPPQTCTRPNKNKAQVRKKPKTESLSKHAREKQVQLSTISTDLTEFQIIMLQKSHLSQLTPRYMRLSDCHIFEKATERCEEILDSFVEGAETDPVPQLSEKENKNKVGDETDVSEDKDGKMLRSEKSSVPASSKKETTLNGTTVKTFLSRNVEGLASTSTSNTTTSNINHVDLSFESESSVLFSDGPETDLSVALSLQPETDPQSISIKTPIRSGSSSSSESLPSSSSSSDLDSDLSSVPSIPESDIGNEDSTSPSKPMVP